MKYSYRLLGCFMCSGWLLLGSFHVQAGILGFQQLNIDLTKPTKSKKQITWSPAKKVTLTKKGLGWDGQPQASWSGSVLTRPLAVGLSWRPTRYATVRVEISQPLQSMKLANGQKYTPHGGQVYARYSPDRKHWSTWQALRLASKSNRFRYEVALNVPRRASAHYNKLVAVYRKRKNVPWRSDEEAFVKQLVKKHPHYFRKHKPFIGYVQVLWEGSFRGGRRMRSLKVMASYSMSGMHYNPSKKGIRKKHKGPWRFVCPSLKR